MRSSPLPLWFQNPNARFLLTTALPLALTATLGCGKRAADPVAAAPQPAVAPPALTEPERRFEKPPAETAEMSSSQPQQGSETMQADPALGASYELEASVPGRWDGVDLIILESLDPVPLEAALVRKAGADPSRESSVRIDWIADAGSVQPQSAGPDQAVALWTPPADSRPVVVSARAVVMLESGRVEVNKRVDFTFLTPLSSAGFSNGMLDGFNLGEYLDPINPPPDNTSPWPKLHPDRYQFPKLFYKVTAETKPSRLSPAITLGHFAIDYPWGSLGMPQYVTIDMNLVEKLEDLMAMMRSEGHKVTTLTPIYGFRAPSFNMQSIHDRPETNLKEEFSMHQYGRAMDFIIDEDGDLIMDDLNNDGRHDIHDAAVIMHYVNILDRKYRDEQRWEMLGGAGLYEFHDFVGRQQSPYIHVDTRGFQSKSNTLIRWKKPDPPNWPDGTAIQWGKI